MPAIASVIIRNIPDATHRALKRRAERHGRSTEAEIRAILEDAVNPPTRIKLGSHLAAIGQRLGGTDLHIERDPTPAEPVDLQ